MDAKTILDMPVSYAITYIRDNAPAVLSILDRMHREQS